MTQRLTTIGCTLAFSLLGAGCVVSTGPGVNTGSGVGSVTLLWTFNNGEGCTAAGVKYVQVEVAGHSTTFPCYDLGNGGRSGTLDNLPDGPQTVTVTGLSAHYAVNGNSTGQISTYQATTSVTVIDSADAQISIDLPPLMSTPATNSNIIFLWTFAHQACGAAGNPAVTLHVDDPMAGPTDATVSCDQNGTDGVKVGVGPNQPGFAAGSYAFTLSAADGSGNTYFASGTAFMNGFSDSVVNVDLQQQTSAAPPAAGVGAVLFDLTFGDQTCSSAQLTTFQAYLTDSMGNQIAGTPIAGPCSSLPITYTNLAAPATYYLSAQGLVGTTSAFSVLQYALSVYPGATSSYQVNAAPTGGF